MIHQKAYAKLDLAISIEPKKKADGYFPVHYIDCQIDLFDQLVLEKQEREIEVICSDPQVPEGPDNFVFKAATLFLNPRRLGAKITLLKNIPIKSGFGGGSSDAAATILGLSHLWKVRLDNGQLKEMAGLLGKDFYYSLHGGVSEVVGIGKNYEVTALEGQLPKFWLLVVVPRKEKPSTGWVYQHLKTKNIGKNFDKIAKLKAALLTRDKMGILENLTNDFEESVSAYFPIIDKMKADLLKVGARTTIMAGAGLAVVGFFESHAKIEVAKNKLKNLRGIRQVLVTRIKN